MDLNLKPEQLANIIQELTSIDTAEVSKQIKRGYSIIQGIIKWDCDNKDTHTEYIKDLVTDKTFTGVLRLLKISQLETSKEEGILIICEVLGMGTFEIYLYLEQEVYVYFKKAELLKVGYTYIFQKLKINFIKDTKNIILLFDQDSSGKHHILTLYSYASRQYEQLNSE